MTLKNIIRVCGLFLIIVSGIGIAQSQSEAGSLDGMVSDSQGEPLPGVVLTITSPVLVGERIQVTNAAGRYRFLGLPPGNYALTAELEGFVTVERPNITVRLGQPTVVNVTMTLASVEEVE